MAKDSTLVGKGLGIATAYRFEDEPSSMVHEQLARLKFAESHIKMEDKSILDFGCGTGYNCYYIAERNKPKKVVGIDIYDECIKYCKQNYQTPTIEFLEQDCMKYNDQLGLFDVVISCEVLEHVQDHGLFIENLKKYLYPGAIAFISTPNKALFSITKNKSFLNSTHVKELYFEEFHHSISSSFKDVTIYSQIHTDDWHSAYIDYICTINLESTVMKNFGKLRRKVWSFCQSLLNPPSLDVRNRKYMDFEFVEGFDSRAVWFAAICKNNG